MKKNLLLSFDYELFLGKKSGTAQNCVVLPTKKLIALFEKFKLKKVLFFVDTTYLILLKQQAATNPAAKNDFDLIRAQLQELIQKGHYVFPHIHPHWLDSTYDAEKNQWSLLDLKKYRFNSISPEERASLFGESLALLKEIIQEVDAAYPLDSYRAGGWCIQPFDDFYPYFKKYNIVNDFSVMRGIRNLYEAQFFNFENTPQKNIYRFTEDALKEQANGDFYEFSISSRPVKVLEKTLDTLLRKYYWKTGNRSFGDGIGFAEVRGGENEKKMQSNLEMISVELLNQVKLPAYKKYLARHDYMHFISHPKMIWQHHLVCFEKFLKFADSKFELETNFRQMI